MMKTILFVISSLFFFFQPLYANPALQRVNLHFEPNLSVCQKTETGFLECESAGEDKDPQVQISLEQIAQVNGIQVWSGEVSQEIKQGNFKVEFHLGLTLEQTSEAKEKNYEFKISIIDPIHGASVYTTAVNDPSLLNHTLIQLPETKSEGRTYLISLMYGAAETHVQKPHEKIPSRRVDGKAHSIFGDLYVENESVDEINVQGSRPTKVTLWEDGVLPLVFKANVTEDVRKIVWEACKEWSSVAKVKCVPGPYKNRELVVSKNYLGIDGGCWSMLGQSTYFLWIRRRMNLGQGCGTYPVILHELGHAFGLGHEHQRPDRDNYVHVLKDNIADPFFGLNTKMNFSTQQGQLLGDYDFMSIMHYSRKAGSKNGKDTILPLAVYQNYTDTIGYAQHLSTLDKVAIQKLYGAL